MKDIPLHDFIVVQMDEPEEATREGILLANKEEPDTGTVLGVGPGRETPHGHTIIPNINPGDRIRLNRHALLSLDKDNNIYLIDFSNVYSTLSRFSF